MKPAKFLLMATLITGFGILMSRVVMSTSSGQEMSAQEKKMMEQMMKYGTPGENHELLERYVGDWEVDIKSWPAPGTEPVMSQGTMKNELIFGGRYLKSHLEGEMSGMKVAGLEIIGYDLFRNAYTTFWIDSWSTSFVTTSGRLDASRQLLTESGEWPDPMTDGKTMQKIKNVTTFLGDGKYKFEMFMVMPDGQEAKGMELLCTRKD
ncbi:MAG: DUF1579 domain-containing protein [Candidatus Aminicenantes bacterium]